MAENYKHLYEQTKKMLTMYQDELIPGFRKKIEELESGCKWIPVTERLPEKEDYYLCCVKSFLFPGRKYINILDYTKGGFQEGHIYTDGVTHWMPLPEIPKENNDAM